MKKHLFFTIILWLIVLFSLGFYRQLFAAPLNLADTPLFLTESVPPLTMIVMGKDHKLYYEAYNDASDLNGDGVLDVGYIPSIDYYGYFDSFKCYEYTNNRFEPVQTTVDKKCNGKWSGDFLNYLTTTRMDAIRKAFYGGYRSIDTTTETEIERAFVPQDAHSWGKEYESTAVNGYAIEDYTPYSQPTPGTRHLFANTTQLNSGNGEPLLRVLQNQTYRIWEWVSIERPVADNKVLNGSSGPNVNPSNFFVRVKVCVSGLLEENCQNYPSGYAKPIGLLHKFGEDDSMKFGLLTGSWSKNLSGGVLRKNVSSFTDEINSNNGVFTGTVGIAKSIDRMKIPNFQGFYVHESNCSFIFNRKFQEGECRSWGNPIAEMMYETLRYYAGKNNPTPAFDYTTGDDVTLGLPKPAWINPYDVSQNKRCAKPSMLVISDINPSYDSDQLPGSYFSGFTGDMSGMNVSNLGQTIWNNETGGSSEIKFIGHSGVDNDETPNLKTITSLGNIRGLSPEEPTKEGSYYSASVAYYGITNDINSADGNQNVRTFTMTFASPVATIPINAGGKIVTIAPYGVSVSGCGIGAYKPTNAIVDFYVESLTPTSGVFRVNFEDLSQGADHDMDAIVKYSYVVNPDNSLTITLNSTYRATCANMHMGYAISGTTNDGIYLEVRGKGSAQYDYFLDTPPGELPGGNWNDGITLPENTSRTFTPSGVSQSPILNNPLWYASKYGNFDDTNGNQLPDSADEWDKDNNGVPDDYYFVQNIYEIEKKLEALFNSVIKKSSSASSSSVNSSALNSETRIYQAKFNSAEWSGQLLAFKINTATGQIDTSGTGPGGALWDVAEILDTQHWNSGREIITYRQDLNQGVKFRWGNIGTTHQNALHLSPITGISDADGQSRLQYIRGNRNKEKQNGYLFRDRENVLGDIINSSPVYVAYPQFPYSSMAWPSGSPELSATENYASYKGNNINRKAMLYVGSNDGMFHFINAETGKVEMSYIPEYTISRLNKLTDPNYSHEYLVDGNPNVGDVFFSTDNKWHTVVVSGLNKGGQALFALDVTDPTKFSDENNAADIALWEFSDSQDQDLGYSFSQPQIVRMANGQWAAIFGNGYNNTLADGHASSTGNAVLYIVDIETGALIKKIDTGVGFAQDPEGTGRPNGLATPAIADLDGDHIADYIYAGDLYGNLWKFDVRDTLTSNWSIAHGGQPVFIAKDSAGNRQSITSRPTLGILENSPSGVQIFFGTGKYLELSDNDPSLSGMQTFYSLFDTHTVTINRTELLQQQILDEQTFPSGDNPIIRVTSNFSLLPSHRGWYMDLRLVTGAHLGERQVTNSILRNGKIIFVTTIPTDDVCEFGGSGWTMELNALNGSRLENSPFDLNKDQDFTHLDLVTYGGKNVAVSGSKASSGIIQTPSILSASKLEYKYSTSTSGNIEILTENPGPNNWGRQSWMQHQAVQD